MMSPNSTTRRANGNLAIRVVIWLLAVVATAGAVLSIDRVLRNRSGGDGPVPAAAILPPSPGGEERSAKTVDTATTSVAALTGVVGDEPRRDGAARDDTQREEPGTPAFDIARVEPSGDTVVAGRATPGATVELLRNGRVHDRVVADASGQFVMVPPRLPAGESELTLRSRPPNGAVATSKQTVVVAVQPNLKDQPVVALMAPDKPSVVLSKPPSPDASSATGSIVVETVEAEAGGSKLYVTGHSAPGALVRLYLNDSYHSTTTADASGRVAFTAGSTWAGESAGRGGDYRIRLDEVDRASGAVKSRAEVPFMPPQQAVATAAVAPRSLGANAREANAGASSEDTLTSTAAPRAQKGQVMTVSRGDSLWRISRLAYGDGARYTVIYDANHKQIRNPNRIYPGQVFIIPNGKGD
jgi:LysM repeat protein